MEVIERFIYTHYLLTGTVVKGYAVKHPNNRTLYFFKIRDEGGKIYDINVPHISHARIILDGKIGQIVTLKIEGYKKGGVERYALLTTERNDA